MSISQRAVLGDHEAKMRGSSGRCEGMFPKAMALMKLRQRILACLALMMLESDRATAELTCCLRVQKCDEAVMVLKVDIVTPGKRSSTSATAWRTDSGTALVLEMK